MEQKAIMKKLEQLETNEKVIILQNFLKNEQINGNFLSDLLLDLIHEAFNSGFEHAIEYTISSYDKKSIE